MPCRHPSAHQPRLPIFCPRRKGFWHRHPSTTRYLKWLPLQRLPPLRPQFEPSFSYAVYFKNLEFSRQKYGQCAETVRYILHSTDPCTSKGVPAHLCIAPSFRSQRQPKHCKSRKCLTAMEMYLKPLQTNADKNARVSAARLRWRSINKCGAGCKNPTLW
jgi:hypothetical protein